MIDVKQMRYFVAVAETLHFRRAAERLHISQPPLSRQIAALEKSLGVRLFDRTSRRPALTHAGQKFLEDAQAVIISFDQACRNAQLAERGDLGHIGVGFMMHAAYTVLPAIVRRFRKKYPRATLELREVLPGILADAVLTGRFDAAIMFDPGVIRGLETCTIHRERLCLAAHASHPLAKRKRISAKELKGESLIATPAEVSPLLRRAVVDYCRSGGFEPVIALEVELQQTIVSLVSENLGIALVPESMAKLGIASLAYRNLETSPVIEHVLAWRPGNLNPALQPFLAEARASAES
jgi:DNA-binding transcriptional LysR family regulator